ncbi:S24 family peptidase [Flavobacterium mekongense]|uniref:S24 family peptidase n=1 Tax=Flavobacterium mekongense TaxID=3379707 RepID=UPI00399AD8AA
MNTIGERIEYLRKKSGKSYNALALLIGSIKADGMRKAILDNYISEYQYTILAEKLGWDLNWIKNGGEEIPEVKILKPKNYSDFDVKLFKPVPFYNLNISAGNITFLDNGLIDGQAPDDYLFIPKNIDADIAFPTFGHSMYPEISNGDKVAYKFIKDWSFFNYGMKYMIVTDEQRMVKYIKKHKEPGFVLLESRNEDYEPIDMPISSIRYILQVRYIGKTEM